MSEKVKQFMAELSKDPMKMEEFWKDPASFLATADLTTEEKDVLRSGDSERIQELIGGIEPGNQNAPHAGTEPGNQNFPHAGTEPGNPQFPHEHRKHRPGEQ